MKTRGLSSTADNAVTASDLARHFGHWQRRALTAPVYVLNHGKPQFVLASLEFMQALNATRPRQIGDDMADLLDALLDPVLICDPAGMVIALGRAARLYFGKRAKPGERLAAFLPTDCAMYLSAVVARVADRGLAERAALPGATGRARLDLVIEPFPVGVVLCGRACQVADERDLALARLTALAGAFEKLPGHAVATIGLRGTLVGFDPMLERLTGHPPHAYADSPAIDLFSASSRPRVGDAVEAIFSGGPCAALEAEVITKNGPALAVSVGLAPLRGGTRVDAVQAIIARHL